jgi:hypothetical protein
MFLLPETGLYVLQGGSETSSLLLVWTKLTEFSLIIKIIIINKKEVDLIYIAVPLSHNIQNIYAQKINKYAELATEIQQMWNVQKINIRPVVISVTGTVPQHLKTQLSEFEITQLLPAIQRSVLLDPCHTVRQFLRN